MRQLRSRSKSSSVLSARVIRGGRGRGPTRSVGWVRWAHSHPSHPSPSHRTPPHLPVAARRVPSSPPLRGGEDVAVWQAPLTPCADDAVPFLGEARTVLLEGVPVGRDQQL